MGPPAALDHGPIGIVTVHGDVLATATGSNAGIETGVIEPGQEFLEGQHVIQGTGFRHIAPVEQGMDAYRPDAFGLGPRDHGLEMVDVAVHVAIGKQTDEMHHAAPCLGPGDNFLPRLPRPDTPGGNRIGHQRRALRVHLSGPQRVVPNLGITHVIIGRHANRRPMRPQTDVRRTGEQRIQVGLAGGGNGAGGLIFRQPVTVHDDQNDGAGNTGEGG